uniref:Excalibur calcium-binding domain-containing protein n=1 Tax=uncultured bacterium A1Q1_fos_2004 TaxID=1256557 RepID=L7W1C8_9BACT|nr:hypothetical protein [uncultured bacterium A1Q1_fos_2004]
MIRYKVLLSALAVLFLCLLASVDVSGVAEYRPVHQTIPGAGIYLPIVAKQDGTTSMATPAHTATPPATATPTTTATPTNTATPTQMATQTRTPTATPITIATATTTPTATPTRTPTATTTAAPTVTATPNGTGCDAAYPTVCIPSPPPNLNCPDITHRNFVVLTPDPHGFDRDGDGIGCEE